MTETDEETVDLSSLPKTVDRSGLANLFANRVRARVLVVLLHAERPLTAAEIATGSDIYQSTVYDAVEPMENMGILVERDPDGADADDRDADGEDVDEESEPRYELADDDLTAALRELASLADERTGTDA